MVAILQKVTLGDVQQSNKTIHIKQLSPKKTCIYLKTLKTIKAE